MFEAALEFPAAVTTTQKAAYCGPERRAGASPISRWLALMLDEIDHGMLLLNAEGEVLHANHAARADLDATHPLQLLGQRLRARDGADVARLHLALTAAATRGRRQLLVLGRDGQRVSVAVVPLGGGTALAVLSRRQLVQRLSVQGFARLHALTPAETRVLESLCEGLDPRRIAELHERGLATVRTQIGSIRTKIGAATIREVVRLVALLPPMLSALRG